MWSIWWTNVFSHFGYNVNTTQQQLVEVSAPHQISTVDQSVFKTRPDFPPQLRRDVQLHTQIPQTHTGQVIHLRANTEEKHPNVGKHHQLQKWLCSVSDTVEDPTFLKNRASEPVRRGRPLPVWGSEVAGAEAMRLGEAVSRNWAVMVPEESHGWTGISVIVRSLFIPADIHTHN